MLDMNCTRMWVGWLQGLGFWENWEATRGEKKELIDANEQNHLTYELERQERKMVREKKQ